DFHVTGVQTCALPICPSLVCGAFGLCHHGLATVTSTVPGPVAAGWVAVMSAVPSLMAVTTPLADTEATVVSDERQVAPWVIEWRSEERRVGERGGARR